VLLAALEGQAPEQRCGSCDNCRRIDGSTAQMQMRIQPEPQPLPDAAPPASAAHAKPRFAPDDSVRVKRYGPGRVVSADAWAVEIEFSNGSRRSFQPDFVRSVRAGAAPRAAG
jgi:ATP-dependent DNA helicase RecQ